MDPNSTPNPPETIGPYRLEELLGRGGMGEVYRAFDERLGRKVAIKHIRPEAAPQRTTHERFRREASTVAKLSHPAIVQIFDVLDSEDGDWIVMEYVDGPTLTALVAEGPMGLERALTYGRQVAEGLAEAHDKGILHRDLKTENVMVTPSGHAKILDFGLAKKLDAESGEQTLTRGGEIMGTGRAMSPEQARGLELGPRSDLFSLGVLLYELLTGRAPFRGQTMLDTLTQLVTSHHVPVIDRIPNAPKELSDLVDRLLEKAPELRPASARQVADTLEDIRLRHFSGVSKVQDLTDFAGATTFVSEATPILGELSPGGAAGEKGQSDSFFRAVSVKKSMWLGIAALVVLVGSAAWWFSRSETESVTPTPQAAAATPDSIDATTTAAEAFEIGQEHLRFYDSGERLEQAIEALKTAVARDPDYAPALAELSYAYWRKYVFSSKDRIWLNQAEALATKATNEDQFYARGFTSLALAQTYLGQLGDAKAAIDRALVLDGDDPRSLVAQAKLAEKDGRKNDAKASYDEALAVAPDDREVLDSAAIFTFRRGEFTEAEALFARSIKNHPEGVLAPINLSTLHYLQGDFAGAARIIQRLLRVNPNPTAYSNLGTYLFYQGLYVDAADAFQKAADFDYGSNSFYVWANLGDAQRWAGLPDEAADSYERAVLKLRSELEVDAESHELKSHLALVLAKRGDIEQARELLAALRQDGEESPDPRLAARLGQAAEIVGDREMALDLTRLAVERGYPLQEIERNPELTDLRADPEFFDVRDAASEDS